MAEEDTSQALIKGLINENISLKSFDLSNGIGIFIIVSKSFMPKSMVLKSFTLKYNFTRIPTRTDFGSLLTTLAGTIPS